MRTPLLVAGLIAALSVATSAAAQDRHVFVASTFTTDRPARAGEASSEAEALARAMEAWVAESLAAAYPCAPTPSTESDVGVLIGHERNLQLLGQEGNAGAFGRIADLIGAPRMAYVTVTERGGQATVSLAMFDMKTTRATARDITTVPMDRDVSDALAAFAKKFVDNLGDAFPRCPTWTGTITYLRVGETSKRREQSGTTIVESSTWRMEYSIRIPAQGKPTIAVTYQGMMREDRSWSYEESCQVGNKRGIGAQYIKKPGKAEEHALTEKKGEAGKPIEVRFLESPTELRVTVPVVSFDVTAVDTLKSVRTAFCGDKDPSEDRKGDPSLSLLEIFPPAIPTLALQPGQDRVQGRFPPADRPQPGFDPNTRETTVTTWDLQRTRYQ